MTQFRFAWKPGETSDRLGHLVMVVGEELDELYDVSVLEAQLHQPGLLAKLLEQAHRSEVPLLMTTTTPVMWSTIPRDPTDPTDRFQALLAAARNLLAVWDETIEDDDDNGHPFVEALSFQILQLGDAVKAWEPR